MEHKEESSATDFTIVMERIHQRERHNSAFYFARDLIQQGDNVLKLFRNTFIRRQDSATEALLFHAIQPQNQPLLGHACLEEHLTLDDWFHKWNTVFSAAHYRGLFEYDSQTLKIGVYFGQDGNVIHINISLLEGGKEKPFPKDDFLLSQLKEAIKPHYQPFQTFF